jgi:pyruvate/2-oxoglutarate dehydrogenase complex dihydrolipoamide acyltransferase (E2) component
MATNVRMPKWGMTMEKGQVNCWLKKEGDRVEQGEALVEVESSKATQFVEAPASGVLAQILVREGQTVPISSILAIIAAPGETLSEDVPIADPPAVSADAATTIQSVPKEPAEVPSPSRGERARGVAASPAARRLARAHHIDLALLQGSGPDGMIVVEDVDAVLNPQSLPISRIGFYSQGHKLDGILYRPEITKRAAACRLSCSAWDSLILRICWFRKWPSGSARRGTPA